jgi:hypothetical protein
VHEVATDHPVVLSAYKTQLCSCYKYPTVEQYKWCAKFENKSPEVKYPLKGEIRENM